MRYRAIHKRNEDGLIHELNKAVEDGYRVISAGASYNVGIGGLEWWAVIERDEKAQQTPEAPKDETAELLEAARKIRKICKEHHSCDDCPLCDNDGCEVWDTPDAWNV